MQIVFIKKIKAAEMLTSPHDPLPAIPHFPTALLTTMVCTVKSSTYYILCTKSSDGTLRYSTLGWNVGLWLVRFVITMICTGYNVIVSVWWWGSWVAVVGQGVR